MSDKQLTWIEQQSLHLVPIERQTIEVLGEEKAVFFLNAAPGHGSMGTSVRLKGPPTRCQGREYL